jgi:DNA polymerase-1
MSAKPLFVILDGYSMAYRHYHGTQRQQLTAPDGSPTGAIYGFARQILDIMLKDKPRYVAVAWDAGLSGREQLYPEYKANRDLPPDDFKPQVERIYEVLAALNVPSLELEGFEADDVIGTLVREAESQGVHSRIVTGDGDLLQLITDNTDVFLMRPFGGPKLYDRDAFYEKYELEPLQLIDLKSLQGDSSDNIPGIRGVGTKTATPLIQTYGSLSVIYEHLDELKGAVRKKFENGRDSAFMSYELARVQTDLPLPLHLPDCVTQDYNLNSVVPLFEELGFRSLVDRLYKAQSAPATPVTDQSPSQMSMFGDVDVEAGEFDASLDFAAPLAAKDLVKSFVVRTEDGLQTVVGLLNSAKMIAFDTETTSTDPVEAELVGISLAVDGENGYYIPVGHIDDVDDQLPIEVVLAALRPALTNPDIGKVAHNASYDCVVLSRYGLDVTPVTFDTMIAEWVRDSASNNLSLSNLVMSGGLLEDGSVMMQSITDLIGKGKKQITMAAVPVSKAAPYAAEDAAMTYRLVEPLRKRLESYDGAVRIFEEIEMPLVAVIGAIEQAGVLLDVPYLQEMSGRLETSLAEIERDIFELSEGYGEFNISSPKQLNDVLFGKLNLPRAGIRKTTHGYSTAADVLDKLYADTGHPILEKILEHRELSKLKGTYVDALPELVNPQTGRLHTSFNQTGTTTGRLSSSNPNLQNIPIRTEIGREVRRAFITPPGTVLLAVDYSQVELRIMAHIADEPYLKQAFEEGQDIHAATAAVVNGIPIDEVTYDQRSFAKRVNFGLLYGMGAFRLARESDLTLKEAESFVETYFERLPNVKKYIDTTKHQLREEGFVETLLGRRRYFGDVRNMGRRDIGRSEREAINMPIQGTAADIMKKAMLELYNALRAANLDARMTLQVHDELVLEVPLAELDQVAQLTVDVMESAYEMTPHLQANAQVGQNWRDMEPVVR